MENKAFVLVIYDVTDNKRRRSLNKILESFGTRIQRSAFECFIDQYKFAKMIKKLECTIDKATDKVDIYKIAKNGKPVCWGKEIMYRLEQCQVV